VSEKLKSIAELNNLREKIINDDKKYSTTIIACAGTGCRACDCISTWDELKKELDNEIFPIRSC